MGGFWFWVYGYVAVGVLFAYGFRRSGDDGALVGVILMGVGVSFANRRWRTLPSAEVHKDPVAGISSQFSRFTAAWVFPGDWQTMDEIPPDWTPVDPDTRPQDDS